MHAQVDVYGAAGVPTRIDGEELDDPVVIGGLRAAQERRARALVLAATVVDVGRVVARRVGVPDLDLRTGDRRTRLVDDAQAESHRLARQALGDVAPVELLVER